MGGAQTGLDAKPRCTCCTLVAWPLEMLPDVPPSITHISPPLTSSHPRKCSPPRTCWCLSALRDFMMRTMAASMACLRSCRGRAEEWGSTLSSSYHDTSPASRRRQRAGTHAMRNTNKEATQHSSLRRMEPLKRRPPVATTVPRANEHHKRSNTKWQPAPASPCPHPPEPSCGRPRAAASPAAAVVSSRQVW